MGAMVRIKLNAQSLLWPCAAGLLAVATSCAVVDSVASGVLALNRYARGIARAEGKVEDGAQTGEWSYLSEGGRTLARGKYENDEAVGVWTYYYENGQIEYEGEVQGDVRVGQYRYGHPNGNPRASGSFIEGREFGEWRFWNVRGTLAQRGTFEDGLRHGRWVSFHPNGTLAADGLYHKGVQVGLWRMTDTGGNESVAWSTLPADTEWVEDRWEDGTLRRAGFLHLKRPQGLWVLNHRSGDPRLIGSFENGVADGPWTAFGDAAEVLAEGNVRLGRAAGAWKVVSGGALREVDAGGFALSMPFQGEWSEATLASSSGPEGALSTWLSEISAPIDEGAIASMEKPEDDAGKAALASADVEPIVPLVLQPWKLSEIALIDTLVDMYSGNAEAARRIGSRYAGRRGGAAKSEMTDGDEDRSDVFVGKEFPLTVFKNEDGSDFLLNDLKGSKIVLVVLRGYGRGVCVYCTTQTKALVKANAAEKFEALGAKLHVVYPGQKNGLETFRKSYATLDDEDQPPYGLLYQNGTLIGDALELKGTMVIPSTFIIDEDGKVAWAYVGTSPEDRPPVTRILKELEKLQ